MRVLHVIPSIAPTVGGPSRSVPRLVETLREQGIDALLAAGGTNDCDLPLDHLRFPGEVLSRGSKQKLAKAIESADVVEIHSLWNGTSSIAASLCQRRGIPYILTPRGMLDPKCLSNHSLLKNLYRFLVVEANIRNASGFHFLSEEERDRARLGREIPTWRIAVSPNGAIKAPEVPTGVLRKLFPQVNGRKVMLHLGRLDRIKRIEIQIRALAKIPADSRPTLLLVGPDYGDAHRLRRIVHEQHLESFVVFGGSVFGIERFGLLAEADLVLLTSIYDCNPVVATEALMMGGAVLATEGCGLSTVAEAGAVKVVLNSLDDFAAAARSLLVDHEAISNLRRQAKEYAHTTLAWKNVVHSLVQLYERLITEHQI